MKWIGIIISIGCIGIATALNWTSGWSSDTDVIKLFTMTGMSLGLIIFILSRDKNEDERIRMLRAQSMSFAFLIGIFYPVIHPITNLILGSPVELITAHENMLFMLVIYIVWFNLAKRRG